MLDWIKQEFAWMHWTWPSAAALAGLALAIVALTVWDMVAPGVKRKGFLPMATTRGDRLFIGIVTGLGVYLFWLGAVGNQLLGLASMVVVGWGVILARWG